MAISLNDHENRIGILENRHKLERLFYSGSEHTGPGYGETFNLTHPIREYTIIIIEILTVDGFFHKFFLGPQFVSSTGHHKYNCTSSWDQHDLIVDLFPSPDGLSIYIAATNPNPTRLKGIHWVYGLTI